MFMSRCQEALAALFCVDFLRNKRVKLVQANRLFRSATDHKPRNGPNVKCQVPADGFELGRIEGHLFGIDGAYEAFGKRRSVLVRPFRLMSWNQKCRGLVPANRTQSVEKLLCSLE